MKTKAKSLMSRKFLLAATTVVLLLLKALFNLTLNEEATHRIVLNVAAYILGQDALSTADAAAA
jgi:hypothetical protein